MIRKIAITGPESVGKSTLSVQLAEHFNGVFVSEFAREYVHNLKRQYEYDDVVFIARKQCEQYDKFIENQDPTDSYVFFDTFLIITKVWFDYVWKRYPSWLDEAIKNRQMDMYLLCSPDIPWQPDPVRENGLIRYELFERYRHELEYYKCRFAIVSGLDQKRLKNAIELVNTLIV
jgi:nicotinamide riboside kinase